MKILLFEDTDQTKSEILNALEQNVGASGTVVAFEPSQLDATQDDDTRTYDDRLEAILRRLTDRAAVAAEFAGAQVDVAALAALRATREANVRHGREQLPSILGVPAQGESAGGKTFDGETEAAMFPGDLPDDPEALFDGNEKAFRGLTATSAQDADYRFLRLRPPQLSAGDPALPQIRLDRALQFLIGDRLQ